MTEYIRLTKEQYELLRTQIAIIGTQYGRLQYIQYETINALIESNKNFMYYLEQINEVTCEKIQRDAMAAEDMAIELFKVIDAQNKAQPEVEE